MSRRWSSATKFWVITFGAVLAGLVVYRLRHLVLLLGLAGLLAYVLNPLVDWLARRGYPDRTQATALVYLGFLVLIAIVPAMFAPGMLEEAQAIDRELLQRVMQSLVVYVQTYNQNTALNILGLVIDLTPLYDQIIQNLEQLSSSLTSQSIRYLLGFASGFVSTLLGSLLILVLSFFMVKDVHTIAGYLENLIPGSYQEEVVGLLYEIDQVWRDFFRGQLVLCAAVGVATGSGLAILGMPHALLLGILAGILQLVPHIGPIVAAIPAITLAFFQGSTHLPISGLWFTSMVALMYVGIQQAENKVLMPRIIGGSVNLHPVVVLIGVLAGVSVAGILGAILVAPIIASVQVVGRYVYAKLLEPPTAVRGLERATGG